MKFIKNILADFLSGRAYSKMKKFEYHKAIPIFQKIIGLDSDPILNALHLFELGYCYYEIGEKNKAYLKFEKSYEKIKNISSGINIKPFYLLFYYYGVLLNERKEHRLSNEVYDKAYEIFGIKPPEPWKD